MATKPMMMYSTGRWPYLWRDRTPNANSPVSSAAGRRPRAKRRVEADRRPQDLGEVGGHRHELGDHPEAVRHRLGELVPADPRQPAPGGDAELGGEDLDENRHQVGGEDHPQQPVAEFGPSGDV